MIYIEAPDELEWRPGMRRARDYSDVLFLAGGITGCPDWQSVMVERLEDIDGLTILNPRRANFPMDDPSAAQAQIEWEFKHLRMANIISFWFPMESICPITLYELGVWTEKAPLLFVGTDEHYVRRQDVEIQTQLRLPNKTIYKRLDHMIAAIRKALTGEF